MQSIKMIGLVITCLFAACYAYQFYYVFVSWRGMYRNRKSVARRTGQNPVVFYHEFAVLICARNEENVIADLIRSIRQQTYPAGHVHIFVMADNCTDNTAEVARRYGAKVYRRNNPYQIGKGYALEALFNSIKRDHPDGFDGYFIFDADNILAPEYIEKMNEALCRGYDIVTCYRNSKNYGDSWISAGNALFFMRESRYMNQARDLCGSSCAVSGTGFMLSRSMVEEMDGWHYHMLTEDIEFSMDQIAKGRRIAYCDEAEIFDEQPVGFLQSWRQRIRWTKGNIAVYLKYGRELLKGAMHGSLSCYDMAMSVVPAYFLSIVSFVIALVLGIGQVVTGEVTVAATPIASFLRAGNYGRITYVAAIEGVRFILMIIPLLKALAGSYGLFFLVGLITTITEWKHIHAITWKKIMYTFTFPLFMLSYLPVAIISIFAKSEWKPIRHTAVMTGLPQVGRNVKKNVA